MDSLKRLKELSGDSEELNRVIAVGYKTLIGLEQLAMPLKDLEKSLALELGESGEETGILVRLNGQIRNLEEVLSNLFTNPEIRVALDGLMEGLEGVVKYLLVSNGKWDKLREVLQAGEGKKAIVSLNKLKDLDYLPASLKAVTGLSFLTPPQVRLNVPYDSLIFLGNPSVKFSYLMKAGYAKKIEAILYPHEEFLFRRLLAGSLSQLPAQSIKDSRTKFLGIQEKNGTEPLDTDAQDTTASAMDTVEVKPLSFLENISRTISISGPKAATGSELVEAIALQLEGEQFYMVRKEGRLNVLDRDKEETVRKEVGQIVPGEEIVILRDSSRDIFLELVSKVESQSGFRERLELSGYWRKSLIEFMKRNEMSLEDFRRHLGKFGDTPETQTIRNWIRNEELIAPHIDTLALLRNALGDKTLVDRYQEICATIDERRSLHIRLGHFLGERLAQAALQRGGDEEEMDLGLDVSRTLEEVRSSLLTLRVENIPAKTIRVPAARLNVLLDLEDLA